MKNALKRFTINAFGTILIVALTAGGIYWMENNKLPNMAAFVAGTTQIKRYVDDLAMKIAVKKIQTPTMTPTPEVTATPEPTSTNTPTPSPYPTATLMPAYPYTQEQKNLASDSAILNDYAKYGFFEAGTLMYETYIPKDWTAVEENLSNTRAISFGPPQNTYQGYVLDFYRHMTLMILTKRDVSSLDVTKWNNKDDHLFDGSALNEWTDITINGKPAKRTMLTQRMHVDTVAVIEGDYLVIFSNYYKDEDAIFKNLIVNFKIAGAKM